MVFFYIMYLCLFTVKGGFSKIILYSNGKTTTYEDAINDCNSLNASLLNYGRNLANAAEQCRMKDKAWVGQPWTTNRGCFQVKQDDVDLQSPHFNFSSLSECLSKCEGERYTYIGVSLSQCFCFVQFDVNIPDTNEKCKNKCYGNSGELCGDNGYMNLYQKVQNLMSSINRQTVHHSSSSGIRLHESQHKDKLNFFCISQTDVQHDEIKCDLKKHVLERISTNAGSSSKVLTTFKPVTPSQGSTDDRSNLAVVSLGIVGIVGLVVITVGGTTFYLRKRNGMLQEIKATENSETKKQLNHDLPENAQKNDDETNNTYDHACHSLLRTADATGNIYDHANSPDGMYDTTTIEKKVLKRMIHTIM